MESPATELKRGNPMSRATIRIILAKVKSPERCAWFAARCALRVLPLAIVGPAGEPWDEPWVVQYGKSLVAASFAAFCGALGINEERDTVLFASGIAARATSNAVATANTNVAAYASVVAQAAKAANAAAAAAAAAYADAEGAAAEAAYAAYAADANNDPGRYWWEIRSDIESVQSMFLEVGLQLPLWNADQSAGWSELQRRTYQLYAYLDADLPALLLGLEIGQPDWDGIKKWLQIWFETSQQSEVDKLAGNIGAAMPKKESSQRATTRLALASLQQTRAETLATVDCLNRSRIVAALQQLVVEREGDQHFALGLFGYWGSGKSSTIEQLKEQLCLQKTDIVVAEFNAWKNEKASNLAAMLAQTVVERLSAGLGFFGKLRLAVRLSAKRHERLAAEVKRDVGKAWTWLASWGWLALPPVLSVLVVGLLLWAIPIADGLGLETPLKLLIGVAAGIAVAYKSLTTFLKNNLTEFFKQIGVERPASLLQLPSYSDQLGLLGEIHLTLKALCELRLGEGKDCAGKQLLLVVDDLDRCGINAVKEVLDAVRLVADIPGVMTLVAIDERMAFAAVEKHYDQFGHAGRPPAQVAREYLAKVLQVSIALPEVGEAEIHGYVEQVLFPGVERFVAEVPASVSEVSAEVKTPEAAAASQAAPAAKDNGLAKGGEQSAEAEAPPTDEPPKAGRQIDQDKVQARALPEEVALFRSLATAYGFGNPRLLWRLHLSWRLLKNLYLGSGVYQFEQIESLMRLFFWREYCLQQEGELRANLQEWLMKGCGSGGPQHLVALLGRLKDELLGTVLSENWEKIQALVDAVLLPASTHLPGTEAKPDKAA